mmetsp:Transcript_21334/g.39025  ORF Transcript_21334/g.39025 Transcript_21334/m.39025 type:complete len:121 (+) Transcript_21334:750-1112(+)
MPSYSWVVNHIDGNKQNNFLANLEFATPAQNAEHAIRTNLYNLRPPCRPVFGRPVGSKEWMRFASQTAAAKHVGCSSKAVSDVCNGHYKRVKGWQFKNVLDDSTLPGEQWAPLVLEPPAE